MLPGPLVLGKAPFPQFNSGKHLIDGDALNRALAIIGSGDSGIVAGAGGTRATAYALKAANSQLSSVVSANDGVLLPPSYPGLTVIIQNDGGNTATVFASGADTIMGTAGATGVTLANAATARYVCILTGQWKRFVSA